MRRRALLAAEEVPVELDELPDIDHEMSHFEFEDGGPLMK